MNERSQLLGKKEKEIVELKKGIEENETKMNQLKSVLSNTVIIHVHKWMVVNCYNCYYYTYLQSGKFDELMVKWQEKETEHASNLEKVRRITYYSVMKEDWLFIGKEITETSTRKIITARDWERRVREDNAGKKG